MEFQIQEDGQLHTTHRLPIGVNGGVNPNLLRDAAARYLGRELFERITRTGLYNEKMESFC